MNKISKLQSIDLDFSVKFWNFFVNCDPDLEVPREIENIVAWVVSRHVHPSEVGLVVMLPHTDLPHAFTTLCVNHVVCCHLDAKTEVRHGLHVEQCTVSPVSLISTFSQNLLKSLLRYVSVINFLCSDLKVSLNQSIPKAMPPDNCQQSTQNFHMKPENCARKSSLFENPLQTYLMFF